MSLIRRSVNEFLPTSFNTLVDKFFNETLAKAGGSTFLPKVDVAEDDKTYEIQVAIPGMKKDDFHLEVNENYLTISGERKLVNEQKDKTFHSIETQYGTFNRTFYIPDNAKPAKIDARYKDGILEVIIPKDEQKTLKTTIKVN